MVTVCHGDPWQSFVLKIPFAITSFMAGVYIYLNVEYFSFFVVVVLKCPFLIYLFMQLGEQKKWLDLILTEYLIFQGEDRFLSGEAPDGARGTCMQTLS